MATISRPALMALLGGVKKVSNLTRNSRAVANQFDVTFDNGYAFQSYESLIAVQYNGRLYLTNKHDYSKTTSKYTTWWTGYTTEERRKGLEDGSIVLID